jgi:hypothetical protein
LKRWLGRILLAATLVVVAGCASMPAVAGAPISDVGVIAGKWAGTMTPGDEPFYLTITPGGTLTAVVHRVEEAADVRVEHPVHGGARTWPGGR